jgi:lipoprotein-releasing system ATP-binding protein
MNIELLNIIKCYPGNSKPILDDINLRISDRNKIAIVGPSGSGKSTLLNLMGTLDFPTNGQVLIDGISTQTMTNKELIGLRNNRIGFVFQTHMLLPQLTVIENILLPVLPKDKPTKIAAPDRAKGLLSEIGLVEKTGKFPGELSVGECQRVAVVRALINQPELLLADEPTGSLDQESSEKLCDILLDLSKKQSFTMIVVTHSLELAQRMDITYKIMNGKIFQN